MQLRRVLQASSKYEYLGGRTSAICLLSSGASYGTTQNVARPLIADSKIVIFSMVCPVLANAKHITERGEAKDFDNSERLSKRT